MKALRREFSMAGVMRLSLGLASLITPAQALGARACDSGVRQAYPTFCSIPKVPTDVRDPVTFKAAVVGTRLAGRDVVERTAPGSWELAPGGADRFAARTRARAAPPPPMTPPFESDSATFVKDARKAATPPPRPR